MATTQLEESQKQLAAMRGLLKPAKPVDEFRKRHEHDYIKPTVYLRPGVLLDPQRRVRKTWKDSAYDGRGEFHDPRRSEADRVDAGDGFGVVIAKGGPFKVRVLKNLHGYPGVGAVISVDALEYARMKGGYVMSEGRDVLFEPVPDDEPERGALLPPNFPTDISKARRLAAKGLRKPEEELNFGDLVKFFEKGGTKVEVWK